MKVYKAVKEGYGRPAIEEGELVTLMDGIKIVLIKAGRLSAQPYVVEIHSNEWYISPEEAHENRIKAEMRRHEHCVEELRKALETHYTQGLKNEHL